MQLLLLLVNMHWERRHDDGCPILCGVELFDLFDVVVTLLHILCKHSFKVVRFWMEEVLTVKGVGCNLNERQHFP